MPKQKHKHRRNPTARVQKRLQENQQFEASTAAEDQDNYNTMVYRRRSSSSAVNAIMKKTYHSTDGMFHDWFVFDTSASKTFYVIDQNSRVIRQAVRIKLFNDMSAEEYAEYQQIATHWHRDSKLHSEVKSNAAANLGDGAMYAAGWRAGYETYKDINLLSKTSAAFGTYAPGRKTTHLEWMQLRAKDQSIHCLYGKRFSSLLPVQFNLQHRAVAEAGLPLLGCAAKNCTGDHDDEFLFGPNITYTYDGFFNALHVDADSPDHMAFGIFFPVGKKSFNLCPRSDGYDQSSGGFINAHYKTFLNFASVDGVVEMAWWAATDAHCTLRPEFLSSRNTHLGSSAQVSQALVIRVKSLLHSEPLRLIIDDHTRHVLRKARRMK